ncbi:hypothetical protein M426DRAFT_182899 [Hypoxylon sp. CI-4A]|nr:hypothetical protein M426DRAFT_182899 [Hypoxylon sp. CI-4A]
MEDEGGGLRLFMLLCLLLCSIVICYLLFAICDTHVCPFTPLFFCFDNISFSPLMKGNNKVNRDLRLLVVTRNE